MATSSRKLVSVWEEVAAYLSQDLRKSCIFVIDAMGLKFFGVCGGLRGGMRRRWPCSGGRRRRSRPIFCPGVLSFLSVFAVSALAWIGSAAASG